MTSGIPLDAKRDPHGAIRDAFDDAIDPYGEHDLGRREREVDFAGSWKGPLWRRQSFR